MDENPNIKIVHNKAADLAATPARTTSPKLGKEGLADIEAVEVDWFAEAMQYSDLLAEVPDERQGPLARLEGSRRDRRRRPPRRLRHRHRPAGASATAPTCSRPPACRATPDEVAALFDGDWNNYFDVADQYKAATGKPMIDAANSVLQGIVNQIEFPYDEPDGTVIATDNPEIEDAYNAVVERAIPNSAYAGQWSDDWNASMANGEFATMLCPAWMLGIIAGNAPEVTGWEIANVFPNGGGNWGGSYLTVPANGKNVEAALALADWLTAPEHAGRRPS